ncbi:MAG: PilZ domain-containing protein [Fimbriimonadaceae bacterium]|nr:PilZ domain-containing protein [Fimbriimonadaceae bacterium]
MSEFGQNPGNDSYADRREHQRFMMLEFARLKIGDIEESSSVLVDISLGGLQVRSRNQYPAGGMVTVTIGRGDIEPISIQAEIRYSLPIKKSDLFATGLKLAGNDGELTRKWVTYVHEIFKLQGEALL